MEYSHLNSYVLRTPLSPIDTIRQMVGGLDIDTENLTDLCATASVSEALFLASPSFYREVQKWLDRKLPNKKEEDKLMQGLYRYMARMCTRCTPFGMFAGISVGEIADSTEMVMSPENTNMLHVRLDMNYICALAKDIAEIPDIMNKILFYPNDSIYNVGDRMTLFL